MSSDRGKQALKSLLALLQPALAAYVPWTYRVLISRPGPPVTVDLQPVATDNPFGALSGVTLWPGTDGGVAVPTVGKLVIVRFNDALTPTVSALDPTDTPAIVYQYGGVVQIGTAAAVPLAKATPVTILNDAIGTWAGAVAGALAAAGQPIVGPTGLLTAAISAADLATPTIKAFGI